MPLERDLVASRLIEKGFRVENNDHTYYRYYTSDGRKTAVQTMLSHGSKGKEVNDYIIKQMARQTKLETMGRMNEFIRCTLGRQEYEGLLVARGIIDRLT